MLFDCYKYFTEETKNVRQDTIQAGMDPAET